MGRCHSCEANFLVLCGINGCPRTYRNCVSFRNHITRKHADVLLAESQTDCRIVENVDGNSGETDSDSSASEELDHDSRQFDVQKTSEEVQRAAALYLLKLKDRDRVPQTVINSIVENTTDIVRTNMDVLKSRLTAQLDTAGIDFNAVPGIAELFHEDSITMNPFSGLANENQQHQYYKDNLNLVVSTSDSSNFGVICMCGHKRAKTLGTRLVWPPPEGGPG